MIITRSPLRISFAGGGTDLPSFYRTHGGGAVTSAAIAQFIHVIVNRKFDRSIRVAYSRTENRETVDEVEHGLVREALKATGVTDSIEVHTIADIPSEGSGLGSSSTLTVGLLQALYAYRGIAKEPGELAEEACRIEIERLGGTLGKQDQYIAAYGGVQHFEFRPDESVRVTPVPLSEKELGDLSDHLSLFFTGVTRKAEGILKAQDDRTAANRPTLEAMRALAAGSRDALTARDFAKLGQLLDDGWRLKRTLSAGISNATVDALYERAKAAGAWGGKITGAGGGGFLLFVHPPDRAEAVASALSGLTRLPVRISPEGSRIVSVQG